LFALTALCGPAYGETPDISGTYWATEYRAKIQVVVGGDLPLTAAGKEAYEKNIAGLKNGSVIDAARRYCVPDGLPRVLATPYPFQIYQAPPGQITIIHELNHQVRVIAMDQPLPSKEELTTLPFYNGHSVGHFEGDILVIETAGFNEKTFMDATGAPHTDEMRTVERIRKISQTELEDLITIHDPMYYTQDWQARFVYKLRNDVWLEDYVCGEPHRDLSSVAGCAGHKDRYNAVRSSQRRIRCPDIAGALPQALSSARLAWLPVRAFQRRLRARHPISRPIEISAGTHITAYLSRRRRAPAPCGRILHVHTFRMTSSA